MCVHVSLGQAVVYLRVKLIGIDLLYDRDLHETVEHTSHMTILKHTARPGYFNLLSHTQNSVCTFYLSWEVSGTDPCYSHFSRF